MPANAAELDRGDAAGAEEQGEHVPPVTGDMARGEDGVEASTKACLESRARRTNRATSARGICVASVSDIKL